MIPVSTPSPHFSFQVFPLSYIWLSLAKGKKYNLGGSKLVRAPRLCSLLPSNWWPSLWKGSGCPSLPPLFPPIFYYWPHLWRGPRCPSVPLIPSYFLLLTSSLKGSWMPLPSLLSPPSPTNDLVSDGVLDSGDQDAGQVLDHWVLILPVMVVLHHLLTVLSLCTYSIKIES